MTYWLINAVFLGAAALLVVAALAARRSPVWRAVGLTMIPVLVLTAVFDNIMIGVGLVGYDPQRISGAFVGIAPLEDFAYAIAAVVLLPTLWSLLPEGLGRGGRDGRSEDAGPGRLDRGTGGMP